MQTFKQFLFEEARSAYRARLLKDLKLKLLGSGAFGDVFQHPTMPDIAVKVAAGDTAYEEYLEWCILHQHNRFVPPIMDWIRVSQPTGQKVSSMDWNWRSDLQKRDIEDIIFFKKLKRAQSSDLGRVRKEFDTEWHAAGFDPEHREIFDMSGQEDWEGLQKSDDPDIVEIATYFAPRVDLLDLHLGNVMVYGRQLVFTDPFADV